MNNKFDKIAEPFSHPGANKVPSTQHNYYFSPQSRRRLFPEIQRTRRSSDEQ